MKARTDEGGYAFYQCLACGREFEVRGGRLFEEKSKLFDALKNGWGGVKTGASIYGKTGKDTAGFFKDFFKRKKISEDICPKCGLPFLPRYKIYNYKDIPDWYECANGHRKIVKAGDGLLKKHRVTILTWIPRLLVILIGIILFSIELTAFGSGDYAGSYLQFALGGGVIGLVSWWLGFRDAQKKQLKDEANETIEKAKEGAKPAPQKETRTTDNYAGHSNEQIEEKMKEINGD